MSLIVLALPFLKMPLKAMASKCDGSARIAIQILENYMLNGGDVEKAISMQIGQGAKLEADTTNPVLPYLKGYCQVGYHGRALLQKLHGDRLRWCALLCSDT